MSKITVKLSENDLLDFLVRNYDKSEKEKKNKSRFLLSLLFLIIAFYFLFSHDQVKAILFFSVAIFWFFVIPYTMRSAVKSTYKEHVKTKMGMILNKPISFELREKGIFVQYDLEEATYSYESVVGVSRAGRNIFINHRGKVPLIIPYKDHTDDIDRFIASLEERLQKARSSE